MTRWEACFSACVPAVYNGISAPLCRLQMTLPHSGDRGALVCLVGNSSGSLFQVFSASKNFQPTGITVLGFTSSTHSRDGVQTSPQGVLWHPKCSNTRRPSPALICVQITTFRCTGLCGCCLKQVMSFICVAITLFNYHFLSGPG